MCDEHGDTQCHPEANTTGPVVAGTFSSAPTSAVNISIQVTRKFLLMVCYEPLKTPAIFVPVVQEN